MTSWLVALIVTSGPPVRSVASCISASESAQEAKLAARYQTARLGFTVCSQPGCPAAIRVDCANALAELDALTPTLVFAVRDEAGLDLPDAEIVVDGVSRSVDGLPVPLDPGPHQVVVRRGTNSLTQTVMVSAAEKGRVVTFTLKPVVGATVAPTAPAGRSLVGPITVSVVAAIGLGLFTGLGLSGSSAWERLNREPCAATRTCAEAQYAPIRTQFLVADLGLGVGLTAAVAALVWWLWPS